MFIFQTWFSIILKQYNVHNDLEDNSQLTPPPLCYHNVIAHTQTWATFVLLLFGLRKKKKERVTKCPKKWQHNKAYRPAFRSTQYCTCTTTVIWWCGVLFTSATAFSSILFIYVQLTCLWPEKDHMCLHLKQKSENLCFCCDTWEQCLTNQASSFKK